VRVIRTPLSLPGRTVIFDYGEVISRTPSQADRAVIVSLAGAGDGAAVERFWTAYFAHRDALDEGTAGVTAYWRAIAADIGARWDEARVHELWAADFRSWLSINPATVDVLADLRAGGTPLALLSNAGPDFAGFFRHGPLGDFFSACYVSGELGLLKPHAEIYRHVLDDLGITPAEAVPTTASPTWPGPRRSASPGTCSPTRGGCGRSLSRWRRRRRPRLAAPPAGLGSGAADPAALLTVIANEFVFHLSPASATRRPDAGLSPGTRLPRTSPAAVRRSGTAPPGAPPARPSPAGAPS
jgi:putative hydrolase of the HAD superfamily